MEMDKYKTAPTIRPDSRLNLKNHLNYKYLISISDINKEPFSTHSFAIISPLKVTDNNIDNGV
jgi:hypothetical protein